MNAEKILGGLILGGIIIGGGLYLNNQNQKQKLVNQIMQVNANNPMFDSDPQKLMKLPINTLKGILSGVIK